jgi:hypothetical protein
MPGHRGKRAKEPSDCFRCGNPIRDESFERSNEGDSHLMNVDGTYPCIKSGAAHSGVDNPNVEYVRDSKAWAKIGKQGRGRFIALGFTGQIVAVRMEYTKTKSHALEVANGWLQDYGEGKPSAR